MNIIIESIYVGLFVLSIGIIVIKFVNGIIGYYIIGFLKHLLGYYLVYKIIIVIMGINV